MLYLSYLSPYISSTFELVCPTLKFTPHFFGIILKYPMVRATGKGQSVRSWVPLGPFTILMYEIVLVNQHGLSLIWVTYVCFCTKEVDSRAAVKLL
jgi:hypothetical protein